MQTVDPRTGAARQACELCPRRCGVDRAAGQRGYCGAGSVAEIYRYGPHHGEEPPISGRHGSGTIFFSRCTMRCIYCQNHPWSQEGAGRLYTQDELRRAFRSLYEQRCHNWNLVSPTPWLPLVREAVQRLKQAGVSLPVVYNTSGFERAETIERLSGWVDVFLTDLRYASEASAAEGSGAKAYVGVAREALLRMWRQAGPLQTDECGIARRGTVCRVLILPGRATEAVDNLRWLAEHVGTDLSVSVMAQYTPAHKALTGRPDSAWGRRISPEEYERVVREVEALGFSKGWVQDYGEETTEDFLGCRMRPGPEPLTKCGVTA